MCRLAQFGPLGAGFVKGIIPDLFACDPSAARSGPVSIVRYEAQALPFDSRMRRSGGLALLRGHCAERRDQLVDLFTAALRTAQPFLFMFAERQSLVESGIAGVAVVFVVGHGTSLIGKTTSPKFSAFRKDCQPSLAPSACTRALC